MAWSKPKRSARRALIRRRAASGSAPSAENRLEGDHRPRLGDRPGVQVADGGDPGDARAEVGGDRAGVEAGRRALEQDVGAVAHHPPGGAEDEDGDEDGKDRVDRGPAGPEDDERGDDGGERAEEVAGDVQERRAQVEVAAVAAGEDEEGDDIGGEPRRRHRQHDAAGHRLRVAEAVRGLDGDPDGDGEEGEAVDEGREHGEPVEAVGALPVGRAAGDAEGEPRHRQRREVGEHVAGVGEERQRAGDDAADDLGDHEAAGEEGRDPDRAGAGGVARDGAVVVIVVVAMMVVVVAHGRASP